MVLGSLGGIVFSVSKNKVKTFENIQIESKVNYAKHTRHNRKPLLEFQNVELDMISFTMYFSAFLGINPSSEQDKIDHYMKSGKVLTLIVGGKRYGGKWVITSHSKDLSQFDKKGRVLVAKSRIELEEYVMG